MILFNWYSFVSVTIPFLFNIIVAPKITYYYWFVISFSSYSKMFLISLIIIPLIALNILSSDWFFNFWLSGFTIILVCVCFKKTYSFFWYHPLLFYDFRNIFKTNCTKNFFISLFLFLYIWYIKQVIPTSHNYQRLIFEKKN